jgi:hypothetical protein
LANLLISAASKCFPSIDNPLILRFSFFFANDYKILAAAPGSSYEKASIVGPSRYSSTPS